MPMKKIQNEIYLEYRRRGFPKAEAKKIARATTYGKIEAEMKKNKAKKTKAKQRHR